MIKFKSLNKSSQFLSILKKRKLDTKYFTLFFDKNNSDKKKVDMNCTYVIFGKNNVYKDKFEFVLNEMSNTFLKIKKFNNQL